MPRTSGPPANAPPIVGNVYWRSAVCCTLATPPPATKNGSSLTLVVGTATRTLLEKITARPVPLVKVGTGIGRPMIEDDAGRESSGIGDRCVRIHIDRRDVPGDARAWRLSSSAGRYAQNRNRARDEDFWRHPLRVAEMRCAGQSLCSAVHARGLATWQEPLNASGVQRL